MNDPSLNNPVNPSPIIDQNAIHPNVFMAYEKAVTTLRSRYDKLGILAGKKHFSDLWARDFCFAGLGALGLGDTDIVKSGLETLLSYINHDGQIPLRVGQKYFILKYLGINAKTPKARYIDDKGHSVAVDNNSLFIILAHRYVAQTGDTSFLTTHFNTIKQAMLWNFTQDSDYDLLIEEGYFAGWADSLKKEGKVLYTNVLHAAASDAFSALCRLIDHEEADHFRSLATQINDQIHHTFWNGTYYIDWVTAHHRQKTFSADGNLLAIAFGIAPESHAIKIRGYIKEHQLSDGFSTTTRHPQYSKSAIYWPFLLINLADYHNGMEWLWVGCADIVAKIRCGHDDEALTHLTRLAHKIIEHNGVFEVYHQGAPVRRLFYSSEEWFAWSSGMFVWACNELGLTTINRGTK